MDSVDRAFKEVNRADFLPEDLRHKAGVDVPLPIGFGQTNSQPTTVRMMLDWLEAEKGQKILDIGSGSGWTSALLANIVGPAGQVYAVDTIEELVEMGLQNCRQAGIANVRFFTAGSHIGLPKYQPYDRILVSAAGVSLPKELLRQLKIGGKMVIPVRNDVLEITKLSDSQEDIKTHTGFVFVPLVGYS